MRDIAFFLLANVLGFSGIALAYHAGITMGMAGDTEKLLNSGLLADHFFSASSMIWGISAVLSIGFFFIKEKWRLALLALPAFMPFLYGFGTLMRLSAAL